MKLSDKVPVEIRGKSREATAIEKSIKNNIEKYGFELVRYVYNRILRVEQEKRSLENNIEKKKRELEELMSKQEGGGNSSRP